MTFNAMLSEFMERFLGSDFNEIGPEAEKKLQSH